jgi:hypothetical protein
VLPGLKDFGGCCVVMLHAMHAELEQLQMLWSHIAWQDKDVGFFFLVNFASCYRYQTLGIALIGVIIVTMCIERRGTCRRRQQFHETVNSGRIISLSFVGSLLLT